MKNSIKKLQKATLINRNPSLQFKKITIAKKGINGGITGGNEQCC